MTFMDRFEGRCWLDWWANSSTNLGGMEVSAEGIAPTEAGWMAHVELVNGNDQEAFMFLCDLDPVFTLRFRDGSTVDVAATPTNDRQATLVEYLGPAHRQITHRLDL